MVLPLQGGGPWQAARLLLLYWMMNLSQLPIHMVQRISLAYPQDMRGRHTALINDTGSLKSRSTEKVNNGRLQRAGYLNEEIPPSRQQVQLKAQAFEIDGARTLHWDRCILGS